MLMDVNGEVVINGRLTIGDLIFMVDMTIVNGC